MTDKVVFAEDLGLFEWLKVRIAQQVGLGALMNYPSV